MRIEHTSWHREGDALVVVRKPTARNVAPAALATLVVLAAVALAWRNRRVGEGLSLAFVALLLGAVAAVRMTLRVTLRATREGMAWECGSPRPSHGTWPRGTLRAVRVEVGPQPAKWGAHRVVNVDAHLHGAWVTLAWGHDEARAAGARRRTAPRPGRVRGARRLSWGPTRGAARTWESGPLHASSEPLVQLSLKETDRYAVIVQVIERIMGQSDTALWLNISVRQVKRLVRAIRQGGAQGASRPRRGGSPAATSAPRRARTGRRRS